MTILRHHPPTAQDAGLALLSGRVLARFAKRAKPLLLRLDGTKKESLELPASVVSLLVDILNATAAGHGLTILPESVELTTVQAARVLQVSRPFLINLLEQGQIPFRKVGKHRRVLLEHVLAYKRRIDQKREETLDQLALEAQLTGMGYPRR